MLPNIPEMPQHLILAIDRHQQLIEDARRQRECAAARRWGPERPLRRRLLHFRPFHFRPFHFRWLRVRVGEMLIHIGQRLAQDTSSTSHTPSSSPNSVWG